MGSHRVNCVAQHKSDINTYVLRYARRITWGAWKFRLVGLFCWVSGHVVLLRAASQLRAWIDRQSPPGDIKTDPLVTTAVSSRLCFVQVLQRREGEASAGYNRSTLWPLCRSFRDMISFVAAITVLAPH